MTKEELYVIIQTTRIVNAIKLFYTIALDVLNKGLEDEVSAKKYMELLFHQAANLYEILEILKRDLINKYPKYLRNNETIISMQDLVKKLKHHDPNIEVLKAIRNKHSFHIGHDPTYIWNYIKEGPADRDSRIAGGKSIKEAEFFYTMDIEPLYAYIKDNILKSTKDIYADVKQIIDEYTSKLLNLFNDVCMELLKGRIYGKGEPDRTK